MIMESEQSVDSDKHEQEINDEMCPPENNVSPMAPEQGEKENQNPQYSFGMQTVLLTLLKTVIKKSMSFTIMTL